jgi:hypothetical protein
MPARLSRDRFPCLGLRRDTGSAIDVPQINAGLTFREALACFGVFAASPKFAGLVLTEFNPDHADQEGEAAAALVRGVVDAVAGKEAPERSDDPTDRERG